MTAAAIPTAGIGPRGRVTALDGLRGVAVSATVAFHMPASPAPGGMIGVDIFFALSGFLIAGILLSQAEAGQIRFANFWAARVRRLVPALALVLILAGTWSWFAASATEWELWRRQAAWGSWYAENIFLVLTEDDYFAEGQVSPWTHLWSLGVEEQFYAVFPLLVAGILLASKTMRRIKLRIALSVTCLVAAAASAAFTQTVFTPESTALSYYDPRAHSYGILLGAALACVWPTLYGWTSRSRKRIISSQLLAGLFLGAIVAVALSASTSLSYTRLGGPLAAAGACALIAACLTPGPITRMLAWRPLVGLGLISYGVYLWSVPISVLAGQALYEAMDIPPWVLWVGCAAATLAAATVSFHVVEMPIRKSAWLQKRPRLTVIGGVAGMATLGFVILLVPARSTLAVGPIELSGPSPTSAALDVPSCKDVPKDETIRVIPQKMGCSLYEPPGSARGTVLLTGNSVAQSLEPGLIALAMEHGWRLWASSIPSCPAFDIPGLENSDPSFPVEGCRTMHATRQQLVESGQVDVVVALDMIGVGTESAYVDRVDETFASYAHSLKILSEHAPVVVIQDFPPLDAPGTVDFSTNPADDEEAVSWVRRAEDPDLSRRIIASAAAGVTNTQLVDIAPYLCPRGWPCPHRIDGKVVRRDQVHFTEAGAVKVATLLEPYLLTALAEDAGTPPVR